MTIVRPPDTTVLLIDGHDKDREYWAGRLKISSAAEYVVLQTPDGASGLAICQSQRIDCVVTELDLPDMSGFEVLIKLVPRARQPGVAVLMLARQHLVPMADLAIKNGAQAYLVKSHVSGDELDLACEEQLQS